MLNLLFIIFIIISNYSTLQQCVNDCDNVTDDFNDFIPIVENLTGFEEGSGEVDAKIDEIPVLCIEPKYTKICSGKGICNNNTCICDSFSDKAENISYRYSGKYCEECPYCRGQRCDKFMDCARCVITSEPEKCLEKCPFSFQKKIEIFRDVERDDKMCDVADSDGCYMKFKYYYDDNNRVFLEIEDKIWCFDGMKIFHYTFWGFLLYLLMLMLIIPKFCPVMEIKERRTYREIPADSMDWID